MPESHHRFLKSWQVLTFFSSSNLGAWLKYSHRLINKGPMFWEQCGFCYSLNFTVYSNTDRSCQLFAKCCLNSFPQGNRRNINPSAQGSVDNPRYSFARVHSVEPRSLLGLLKSNGWEVTYRSVGALPTKGHTKSLYLAGKLPPPLVLSPLGPLTCPSRPHSVYRTRAELHTAGWWGQLGTRVRVP